MIQNDYKINPMYLKSKTDMLEYWLPITEREVPGIKPYYYISTFGRVYSIYSHMIMSYSMHKKGYYQVGFSGLYDNRVTRKIHRIVLMTFEYRIDNKHFEVNHKDGNKLNNHLWNLEWVTPSQNSKHSYITGLQKSIHGENSHYSKITEIQATKICKLLSLQKYTYRYIANIVGCSYKTVSHIANKESWVNVSKNYNFKKGDIL